MGHIGLTPQSVRILGYRQQGKTAEQQEEILNQAIALEKAGAFSIVLEHINDELASEITKTISIPTIGIGAGKDCDGQVLVTADLLGLSGDIPPFAKQYCNLQETILNAVSNFADDVQAGKFPN